MASWEAGTEEVPGCTRGEGKGDVAGGWDSGDGDEHPDEGVGAARGPGEHAGEDGAAGEDGDDC